MQNHVEPWHIHDHVYSSPIRLRAQGILRNLSNIDDGLFSTEPCVTLVFSELEA